MMQIKETKNGYRKVTFIERVLRSIADNILGIIFGLTIIAIILLLVKMTADEKNRIKTGTRIYDYRETFETRLYSGYIV